MLLIQRLTLSLVSAIALTCALTVRATEQSAVDADVHHLSHEWAHIKYQIADKSERLHRLEALDEEAAVLVARYPGQVGPLLWEGIITSEQAPLAGMFSRLGLATKARDLLERAERVDAVGRDGAVAMSLGVLYYRVPGFPVGFGDMSKAQKYLEIALAASPDGLDSNYFYGDFLIKKGEYGKALTVLTHALDASLDPYRPIFNAGRRAEVQALIVKARKHLNT